MSKVVANCLNLIQKPDNFSAILLNDTLTLDYETINVSFIFSQEHEDETNIKIEPITFPLAHHVLRIIRKATECLKTDKKDTDFDPFTNKYKKDGVKDFDKLLSITSQYSEKTFIGILNDADDCLSDLDVFNKLGKDLYSFIKFIIITNK